MIFELNLLKYISTLFSYIRLSRFTSWSKLASEAKKSGHESISTLLELKLKLLTKYLLS
jgi:hypothetical protein